MNAIKWIENWYQIHCNDDWGHSFGIRIEIIDNPGWSVKIHTRHTAVINALLNY